MRSTQLKTFSYQSHRLTYFRYGKGPFTLIFLPGLGCTASTWDKQVAFFKSKFKVITVNLLGHGESSKQGLSSKRAIRLNASVVQAFLKALEEPFVIVGHSWAGCILSRINFLKVPSARGVVFVDSTRIATRKIQDSYKAFAKEHVSKNPKAMRLVVKEWYQHLLGPTDEATRRSILNPLLKSDLKWVFEVVRDIELTPRPRMGNLAVWICESDQYFSTKTNRSFTSTIPKATHSLLKGANHFFFLTQPKRFNVELKKFIKSKDLNV